MKCSNDLILEVFALAQQMITLSHEGTTLANDDGCRLLFSILGDCAYKLKMEAEREKKNHQKKGKWQEEPLQQIKGGIRS